MNLTASAEYENMGGPQLGNPLFDHLGLKLVLLDVGRCESGLAVSANHLNQQSSLDGGVVAVLLEAACDYAVLITTPYAEPRNASTVMLTISYLDKAGGFGRLAGSRGGVADSFSRWGNC
jgi:acyl-coenzyme A thioesterase PaaI-like protein